MSSLSVKHYGTISGQIETSNSSTIVVQENYISEPLLYNKMSKILINSDYVSNFQECHKEVKRNSKMN